MEANEQASRVRWRNFTLVQWNSPDDKAHTPACDEAEYKEHGNVYTPGL